MAYPEQAQPWLHTSPPGRSRSSRPHPLDAYPQICDTTLVFPRVNAERHEGPDRDSGPSPSLLARRRRPDPSTPQTRPLRELSAGRLLVSRSRPFSRTPSACPRDHVGGEPIARPWPTRSEPIRRCDSAGQSPRHGKWAGPIAAPQTIVPSSPPPLREPALDVSGRAAWSDLPRGLAWCPWEKPAAPRWRWHSAMLAGFS